MFVHTSTQFRFRMRQALLLLIMMSFPLQSVCRGAEPPLGHIDLEEKNPRLIAEIGAATFTDTRSIEILRWSSDSQWLFTSMRYIPPVSQFDAKTGVLKRRLLVEPSSVEAFGDALIALEHFGPDSKKSARFGCWNLADLSLRWSLPDVHSVSSVAFSRDGKRVALSYRTLRPPQETVRSDGRRVIDHSKRDNSHFAMFDVATGKEIWRSTESPVPGKIIFLGDGLLLTQGKGYALHDSATGLKTGALTDRLGNAPSSQLTIADVNPRVGTILLLGQKEFQLWQTTPKVAPVVLIRAEPDELFTAGSLLRTENSVFVQTYQGGRIYGFGDRGVYRKVPLTAKLGSMNGDGSLFACAEGRRISVVSASTWQASKPGGFFPHGIKHLEFSPDGTLLGVATCGRDTYTGNVFFFDGEKGHYAGRMPGELRADLTYSFRFHPAGKTVVALHGNGLRQWDLARLREAWRINPNETYLESRMILPLDGTVGEAPMQLTVNGDGTRWGLLDSTTRPFLFSLPPTGELDSKAMLPFTLTKQQTSNKTYTLQLSPDGSHLAVQRVDSISELYDTESRSLQQEFRAYFHNFAPDGKTLVQSNTREGRALTIVNVESGNEVVSLPLTSPDGMPVHANDAVFSRDGTHLVVAVGDQSFSWTGIQIWNVTTGKQVAAIRIPRGSTSALALRADNQRLAVVHGDNSITLWDVRDLFR